MQGVLMMSLLAGLATSIGALPLLIHRPLGPRSLSLVLGLASGVMSGVVVLDLLPSAWETGTPFSNVSGFLAGVMLMVLLDRLLRLGSARLFRGNHLRRVGCLMAIAIALHDMPEGMAIAAGSSSRESLGLMMALAIGLHNMPEGLAVATPLRNSGMPPLLIFLLVSLISLFTPAGTLLGLLVLRLSPGSISLLMALAAGAMVYLVVTELWPQAVETGRRLAWTGAWAGVGLAALLSFFHSHGGV